MVFLAIYKKGFCSFSCNLLKNIFSVVFIAIDNASYEFLIVNIGQSGRQNDAGSLCR